MRYKSRLCRFCIVVISVESGSARSVGVTRERDPTRRGRRLGGGGGGASYFLPRGRLSQSRTDVAASTVSYDRSTLNLIHFNLTKVPADSEEEGLISAGRTTAWFTTDSRATLKSSSQFLFTETAMITFCSIELVAINSVYTLIGV